MLHAYIVVETLYCTFWVYVLHYYNYHSSCCGMYYFSVGPPVITFPPVDEFVVVTEDAMFKCTVDPPMTSIRWNFVNALGDTKIIADMNGGKSPKYRVGSAGLLNITNVQYSDRGEYICTATNRFGNNSASATLTVHGNHC